MQNSYNLLRNLLPLLHLDLQTPWHLICENILYFSGRNDISKRLYRLCHQWFESGNQWTTPIYILTLILTVDCRWHCSVLKYFSKVYKIWKFVCIFSVKVLVALLYCTINLPFTPYFHEVIHSINFYADSTLGQEASSNNNHPVIYAFEKVQSSPYLQFCTLSNKVNKACDMVQRRSRKLNRYLFNSTVKWLIGWCQREARLAMQSIVSLTVACLQGASLFVDT